MNSKVTKGTERYPAARQTSARPPREQGPAADRPAVHDPEAEALLRRFLSEVHSYRQIGNAALRDLESRLSAMSEQAEPQPQPPAAAPEPAAEEGYHAPPPAARQPSRAASGGVHGERSLSDRLSELSTYLDDRPSREVPPPEPARREQAALPAAPRQPQAKKAPTSPVLGRAWFEERFAAMRASIDEMSVPMQRLDALEGQFKLLMERLDARDAQRDRMGPVEDGLKRLAAYLDDSRKWNAAHDTRLRGVEQRLDHLSGLVAQSHAAIAATAKGLEIVAKGTGPNLAHATADLVVNRIEENVVSRIEEKIARSIPGRPLEELSQEVSTLSVQSRQSARNVDEQLKQLHAAMDEGFARRAEATPLAVPERARSKPPSTESIEKYLAAKNFNENEDEDYDRELIAAAQRAARLADAPQRAPEQAAPEPVRHPIPYGEILPEEERRNSHLGLIAAAIILMAASAAMLYLNLRHKEPAGIQPTSAVMSSGPASSRELVRAKQPAPRAKSAPAPTAEPPAGVVLSDDAAVREPQTTGATGNPAAMISTDSINPAGQTRGRKAAEPASAWEADSSVRQAAVKGDREAQFTVGQDYLTGRDPSAQNLAPEDRLSKATRWFRRAAEAGHAASQYRLATLYELGHGAPKDMSQAEFWYRRAAEQGHVKAMHNLAVLAVPGQGRQSNYLTAVKWFGLAAEYGLSDSQFNLAVLYERGLGVPRDLAMAYQWYALAVRNGDLNAAGKRDAVGRMLSAEARRTADAAVAHWTARTPDPSVNGAAPEPPAAPEQTAKAVIAPEVPRAQVLKASWSAAVEGHSAQVMQAQRHLERLGYKPGPADGIAGPRTAAAIREFEARSGLTASGQVTEALLKLLAAARG